MLSVMASITELYGYLGKFISEFNEIISAVIILLLGFIIARILYHITYKLLHEAELDNIIKATTGIKISLEKTLAKFVRYFVYFIAIITVLNQLGLTTTLLYIIAAVILLIIAVSFLLGVRDFIPNFFSGIVLSKEKRLRKGDFITLNGIKGKVVQLGLLETKIETKKGDTIYIPNRTLTKQKLVIKKKSKR